MFISQDRYVRAIQTRVAEVLSVAASMTIIDQPYFVRLMLKPDLMRRAAQAVLRRNPTAAEVTNMEIFLVHADNAAIEPDGNFIQQPKK